LTVLQTRKQLLVTVAEVQREQLDEDLATIQDGVHGLGRKVKLAGTVASGVAMLATVFSLFRRKRSPDRNGKTSLISGVVQGARLASAIVGAFRSVSR
jgi:hypothetical protein